MLFYICRGLLLEILYIHNYVLQWHVHESAFCIPFHTAAKTFVKTLKRQIAIMELAKVLSLKT